jgi:serine protease inhibitor
MITLFKKFFLVLAVLLLAVSACSDDDGIEPGLGVSITISPDVAARTTDFAFDFFKTLQTTQPENDNLFVSPLGLHIALGMLLNGANNRTASEIKSALKVDGIDDLDLNSAYKSLQEGLPQVDPQVQLSLANSVWSRNGFSVHSSFIAVLKKWFNADAITMEFNDAGVRRINQWASDKTNGKIEKVIGEFSDSDVMFLMNALYFKGDWKHKFDPANTIDRDFKLADGGQKRVKMMSLNSSLQLAQTSDFSAVELPYSNGKFNFTLLLPNGNKSVAEVGNSLSSEAWKSLTNGQYRSALVNLNLPKFQLDYEVQLKSTLKKMGIEAAFDSNSADFSRLSDALSLQVSEVKQNTYLGIDEKGTEAAAVTTIGMELTSVQPGPTPIHIVADRPFLFVISENTSNTILFVGRITNP